MFEVVDAHADTLVRLGHEKRDFCQRSAVGHLDLPRLREANVRLQVLALCARAEGLQGPPAAAWALEQLGRFHRLRRQGIGRLIEGREDLAEAGPAYLLHFEGAEPLCGSLEAMEAFFELGIRSMGLTWNGRNEAGDGLGGGGEGLTPFGRQLVAWMNQRGVLIDLAHLDAPGFWEVMALTQRPVAVSHANARALCDHPRNLTDEQAVAVARGGGVIGVTFVPEFLTRGGAATLDDVVRHVDHLVGVVGIEHVAFGSDFDGFGQAPVGLEDVSRYPALLGALLARGYTPEQVARLAGGNWLKLYAAVLPGRHDGTPLP